MFFRQLFDQDTSTYTYLLADEASREALLIDPVLEQLERDSTLIDELKLKLIRALDTHVHADHVTALGLLKRRFGAETIMAERGGAVCADRLVKQGDRVRFGRYELEVRETPGHTSGCLTYVCHDPRMAFTGDALLIRGSGRTDFQQGSARTLYRSVREQIFSLSDDTLLYPGHDYKGRTVTTVGEEKALNPRLGMQTSLEDFERIMNELELPQPRKMAVAVPANLSCGVEPAAPSAEPAFDTSWAPIELTSRGVPELKADWLSQHAGAALVLDVREPDEFRGELGHVAGAELMPLQTLEHSASALPRDRPVVVVCRSGGRSGKAALLLQRLGFARVASLEGGMLSWNAQGLAIELGAAKDAAFTRQG